MPKRNVYVSEELDELIRTHEGPVPLSRIVTEAIQKFLGEKVCPACGQTVTIKKASRTRQPVAEPVENAYTIKQMQKMPWAELKGYAREIDDGTIEVDTRKRQVLIDSIVASTGQEK